MCAWNIQVPAMMICTVSSVYVLLCYELQVLNKQAAVHFIPLAHLSQARQTVWRLDISAAVDFHQRLYPQYF